MDLKLERLMCGRDFTIGSLFIDDQFECWTLEDQLRPSGVKVPGATCIPAGRYLVQITFSNRFQRPLPLLLNVPMFEGIRIHPGNTSADTEGCILVGADRGERSVGHSQDAFRKLFAKLNAADNNGVPMWISVENGIQTPPEIQ